MKLFPGLHESLLTSGLQKALRDLEAQPPHLDPDLFLITLNKTEKRFSPTTRYRDYALSRDLLRWESQSGTTASSPTGKPYQQHVRQGSAAMRP